MEYQGICHKMKAVLGETVENERGELAGSVEYKMVLAPFEFDVMPLMNQHIILSWTGRIACVGCGAPTPKSYGQGYCYKCLITKASCDMCMVKPETCHFHLGTCREPDWAENFCFAPHIVYLANSSGIKVGITRQNQMPTRWLDQGASQALPLLQATSRRLVGLLEVMFGQSVADKTNWRALLKGDSEWVDLYQVRDTLLTTHAAEIAEITQQYAEQIHFFDKPMIQNFVYPIQAYPQKIVSLNLDKTPSIAGQLQGIKGQYLILDTGVINLRKYSGYELVFSA